MSSLDGRDRHEWCLCLFFARGAIVDCVWRGQKEYHKHYQPALELASSHFQIPRPSSKSQHLLQQCPHTVLGTTLKWHVAIGIYWYACAIFEHAEVLFQGQRLGLALKENNLENVSCVT